MNCFVLVPTHELTIEMMNRSVSQNISDLPVKTYESKQYYLLEIEMSFLQSTNIFDRYFRAFTQREVESFKPIEYKSSIDYKGLSTFVCNAGTTALAEIDLGSDRILKKIFVQSTNNDNTDRFTMNVLNSDLSLNKPIIDGLYMCNGAHQIDINKEYIDDTQKIQLQYQATSGVLQQRSIVVNAFMERPF